nr:hypothetical protein [Tanacetum cinerariifolium]
MDQSYQVAILANQEKSPLEPSFANDELAKHSEVHEPYELNTTNVFIKNGESRSSESNSNTTVDTKRQRKREVLSLLTDVLDKMNSQQKMERSHSLMLL